MKSIVAALLLSAAVTWSAETPRVDAPSKVVMEGEAWQQVGAGYVFTDAACGDAEGNFYFADLPKGIVYKVSPTGQVAPFLEGHRISGLKFGPDGRLYACTQAPKKQIVAITLPSKDIKVIAGDVEPNDLAVSKNAYVYFTDTAKGRVMSVDIKSGKVTTAATGLLAPNGIALSADGQTLAVSEYRGTNVWVFVVKEDGTITSGARYMTLSTPARTTVSSGDGMCADASGRWYVTSALGIQVFDSKGRLEGIIERPQQKGIVSCGFGGPEREYLYVCSTDKVYRRKTRAQGIAPFKAPAQ